MKGVVKGDVGKPSWRAIELLNEAESYHLIDNL